MPTKKKPVKRKRTKAKVINTKIVVVPTYSPWKYVFDIVLTTIVVVIIVYSLIHYVTNPIIQQIPNPEKTAYPSWMADRPGVQPPEK